MIHETKSDLAGRTVMWGENEYVVEDWWDRVSGESWAVSAGNFAALKYAFRIVEDGLPMDDEVVYGKVGSFGHLVHVSELKGGES